MKSLDIRSLLTKNSKQTDNDNNESEEVGGILFTCSAKKFTGNTCAPLRLATLLNERLWHRYFSVDFAKFLGTFIL